MPIRWWVCVECGDYWPQEDEPARDLHGRVLCAACYRGYEREGRV